MTFQYIRRRPHIQCHGNPFAAEWLEKNGVFVHNSWNAFYWRDSPKEIYSIWEIGEHSTHRGAIYFKVKNINGSKPLFGDMELQLGAICHLSTEKYLTIDELLSFKKLL